MKSAQEERQDWERRRALFSMLNETIADQCITAERRAEIRKSPGPKQAVLAQDPVGHTGWKFKKTDTILSPTGLLDGFVVYFEREGTTIQRKVCTSGVHTAPPEPDPPKVESPVDDEDLPF